MTDKLEIAYAVRQESTGLYLADVRGRHTSAEPETLSRSPGMPHGARLTTTYAYASARRVSYVKGECQTAMESETDDYGGNVHYYRTEPQWTGEGRKAEDYRVVAFALVPLGSALKAGKPAVELRCGYQARDPNSGMWYTITEGDYLALSPTSVIVRRIWIEENCE